MSDQLPAGRRLRVVGIGGSTRARSTTEQVLEFTLGEASRRGAETTLFGSEALMQLRPYCGDPSRDDPTARKLLAAMAAADAVVIASPGYHGTVSGLVKNALDHLEELRGHDPPYLTAKPVGCIATAYGWQAAVSTLATLRQVVHALRGWPSPLGAAINMVHTSIDASGTIADARARATLSTIATEICDFASVRCTVA
jgi:FMN reductase